jgi:hypothetical protein
VQVDGFTFLIGMRSTRVQRHAHAHGGKRDFTFLIYLPVSGIYHVSGSAQLAARIKLRNMVRANEIIYEKMQGERQ